MIEKITWLLLGCIAGTFTGITPGIHANTIAFMALYAGHFDGLNFAVFVVAMGITHSFVDSIPTIILGAPGEDDFLASLPGHALLMKGKGIEAITHMTTGGIVAIIFSLALVPFFFSFAINYGKYLPLVIPAILATTMAIIVAKEKNKKAAMLVIGAASIIGIIAFESSIPNPIMALVSGFFAFPGLIMSILKKSKVPEQKIETETKTPLTGGFLAALASSIVSMIPGIGPSQAAIVTQSAVRRMGRRGFLAMVGGMNTANLFFSLLALYALGKTRTGMAIAINDSLEINLAQTAFLASAIVASSGIAALITIKLGKIAAKAAEKYDYSKASMATAIFLCAAILFFCGPLGLLAAMSAAGISMYAWQSGAKRSNCMAFLIAPTAMHYLGIGI
ncbi:MAG: tripartite tricarboxylate transporter permease [archaeon]|nr:tripartite tricarboxylate transporter permease [archaeon]